MFQHFIFMCALINKFIFIYTLSGSLEEGLAALTRIHSVVVATGGVRANLTLFVFEFCWISRTGCLAPLLLLLLLLNGSGIVGHQNHVSAFTGFVNIIIARLNRRVC